MTGYMRPLTRAEVEAILVKNGEPATLAPIVLSLVNDGMVKVGSPAECASKATIGLLKGETPMTRGQFKALMELIDATTVPVVDAQPEM